MIIRSRYICLPLLLAGASAFGQTSQSYVRTWEPFMPSKDTTVLMQAARTGQEVKQTTQYLDGLGRPLQTVSKAVSNTGKDLVKFMLYDRWGRDSISYLPYVQTTGKTSDGSYKPDPFTNLKTSVTSLGLYPGDTVYYGKVVYESSPLARAQQAMEAGNSWAGSNRGALMQYLANTTADGVRIWNVSSSGVLTTPGAYLAGQLYKELVQDEDGRKVIEFKDKAGKVVCRKIALTGSADGHTGWLSTYFVYDTRSLLRIVIPPKAVDLLATGSWAVKDSIINGLCFRYEYDERNRPIKKRLPDTPAEQEMVYDKRDRLVFSRDGNLKKQNQWMVTFYDGIDRPVTKALYRSSATRDQLQTSLNAITTTNPVPVLDTTLLTPLISLYYDNYEFAGRHLPETGDFNRPQAGTNVYAVPVSTYSKFTQGLATGRRTRVLGTGQWLTSTFYYDDKGRTIQAIADNIAGGKDITTTLYNFSGQVLSTYDRHRNPAGNVTTDIRVLTMFLYNAAGNLVSITKELNDDGVRKQVVTNTYDEINRLTKRVLGNNLESMNYEYNIRNWMVGMNRDFLKETATNFFGFELAYDKTASAVNGAAYATSQYSGNIAGTLWRNSNGARYKYDFGYDNGSRLLKADFNQYNAGSWVNTPNNFSMKVGDGVNPATGYDANGNILKLWQMGLKGASSSLLDDLTYRYQDYSNRPKYVRDAANDENSTLGDFREPAANNTDNQSDIADYSYDDNGNLTSDKNKKITGIAYNHLNLPEVISLAGKGTVQLLYDASGGKLRKIVRDSTLSPVKVTTTDYINGIVYVNDTLQLIGHEEGRIRAVYKTGQPMSYVYDYFVKDHLGSVRLVLTEQSDFSMYAATMETESAATEAALFSNVEETRTAKPVGYPQDNNSTKNSFVAKLNARSGGNKIGPSLVLKVMAGDTVQIGAKAFYKSTGPKDNRSVSPEDMIAGLVQAFGGETAGNGSHGAQARRISPFTGNFKGNDYQRLKERSPDQHQQNRPRAYLNYVLFDEQFNLVEDNSGVRQVKAAPDELQTLAVDKMPVTRSGFLYVYASNETEQDVYFDNVTVAAISGPVLEETHYYPFGLTMAGISSQSLPVKLVNRQKYNGKDLQQHEFSDGAGLEWYDYGARMYDPQTGRFTAQDAYAEKYYGMSPYQYAANNPIKNIDVNGDSIWVTTSNGTKLYYGYTETNGYGFYYTTTTEDPATGFKEKVENFYTGNDQFVNQVSSALGRLKLGTEGNALVEELVNSTKNMSIVPSRRGNLTDANGLGIGWDPSGTTAGPDENGSIQRPTFIGLGHELAHQKRIWNSTVDNSPWATVDDQGNPLPKPVPRDDIYASHMENKIRAEHGLPLRTHYSRDAAGTPVETTRILKAGTRESLYYDSSNNTNYQLLGQQQTPYTY